LAGSSLQVREPAAASEGSRSQRKFLAISDSQLARTLRSLISATMTNRVLTLNSGSSSLKFSLHDLGDDERLVMSGVMSRIGLRAGSFKVSVPGGRVLVEQTRDLPDWDAALEALFDWLTAHVSSPNPDALGHRVVHGGTKYRQPTVVNDEVLDDLKRLVPLAPDHLPREIGVIQAARRAYDDVEHHIACFDTSFHRSMPEVARLYALPLDLEERGILRYGFHGLSYEYINGELQRLAGPGANGRVVIAHLGSGASMAALRGGSSIDTTMGFTPAGGLVMSTRCGDLDPGLLVHLLEEDSWTVAEVNELVNRRSGLLGLSGISPDMQELLQREREEPRARRAIDVFCYQARKYLGALAATLGGLDTLVFTAGIGENAPSIRERICDGLGFLGIRLHSERNAASADVISADGAPTTVRVMATDEELMIARHVRSILERVREVS
jgi:acetate kinase